MNKFKRFQSFGTHCFLISSSITKTNLYQTRYICSSSRLCGLKFHPNNHPNQIGRKSHSLKKEIRAHGNLKDAIIAYEGNRDQSKRNLKGEALEEKLAKIKATKAIFEPYFASIQQVVEQFKVDVAEEEQKKYNVEGTYMQAQEEARVQQMNKLNRFAKSAKELAEKRVQREAELIQEELEKQNQEIKNRKKFIDDERERKKGIVLEAIEESKTFVTPENLEERIEMALDDITNYNFAITPLGEKIHSTQPPGNANFKREAGPHAFIAGGILPGSEQWNKIFQDRITTFDEKHIDFQKRKERYDVLQEKKKSELLSY